MLDADRAMNVLHNEFVNRDLLEEDTFKAREKTLARAQLMFNSTADYESLLDQLQYGSTDDLEDPYELLEEPYSPSVDGPVDSNSNWKRYGPLPAETIPRDGANPFPGLDPPVG